MMPTRLGGRGRRQEEADKPLVTMVSLYLAHTVYGFPTANPLKLMLSSSPAAFSCRIFSASVGT
jgi:hypothetical protein